MPRLIADIAKARTQSGISLLHFDVKGSLVVVTSQEEARSTARSLLFRNSAHSVCVFVCVWSWQRERERERERS